MSVPVWPDQLVVTPNAIWVGGNKPGSAEGRLVRVNPGTGSIVADIPVGRQPAGVAVSATDVWVTSTADDSLSRVSIRRSAVVATIHTPHLTPAAVAISPGAVWIASSGRDSATLTRVDPATGRVTASISVPPTAMDVVYAGHAIWVASELNGGALTKVDPVSGKVLLSMRLPNIPDPYDMAALGDTLAVVGENNRAVDLVSMPDGKVKASIPLPFYTAAVSADSHGVYVASNGRTVARFPVSSPGSVSRSPISRTLPSLPGAMTTGLGSVWFASNNTLIRIPAS
jgi:DNA-binding beta-propeller fold protein YncE